MTSRFPYMRLFLKHEQETTDMRLPNNKQLQRHWPPVPPQWQVPQRPRPRRKRFRWWLIWLPLVLAALVWIYNSIEIEFSWDELLDGWDIANKPRFTALAILGTLACCICAIVRVLRKDKGNES